LETIPGPTLTDNNFSSPLNFFANINGFRIACINVNSLMKHIDEIVTLYFNINRFGSASY
jgi:hypothetical protein